MNVTAFESRSSIHAAVIDVATVIRHRSGSATNCHHAATPATASVIESDSVSIWVVHSAHLACTAVSPSTAIVTTATGRDAIRCQTTAPSQIHATTYATLCTTTTARPPPPMSQSTSGYVGGRSSNQNRGLNGPRSLTRRYDAVSGKNGSNPPSHGSPSTLTRKSAPRGRRRIVPLGRPARPGI